jgi:hypothetical protein
VATNIHLFVTSRSVVLRMRNISDESSSQNQSIHSLFSNFLRKSCCLWDNLKKYRKSYTAHRWQYNTAHADGVLDTYGCKHPLKIYNTLLFHRIIGYINVPNVALYVQNRYCFCLESALWNLSIEYLLTRTVKLKLGSSPYNIYIHIYIYTTVN